MNQTKTLTTGLNFKLFNKFFVLLISLIKNNIAHVVLTLIQVNVNYPHSSLTNFEGSNSVESFHNQRAAFTYWDKIADTPAN